MAERIRIVFAGMVSILLFLGLMTHPAQATTYYTHATYQQQHPVKAYFHRHPYQKTGLIGGGVGAGVGALLGGGKGALTGGAIGAGAGVGYEYLKKHF